MKKTIFHVVLVSIMLSGCTSGEQVETEKQTHTNIDTVTDNEWQFKGIPKGATLMDCLRNKILFHERDKVRKIERLWIYEIKTQKATVFLTCHRHYGPTCYSGQNGYSWPRDSICNICMAQFVNCQDNKIVVGEGCATYQLFFVVSDNEAVYLSGGNNYLGELYENGWYVIEERSYDEKNDPYSILSYYDEKGILMRIDKCIKGTKRYN